MIAVEPYGGRFFAVYEDEALLAVCAYRKGAQAVQERLEVLLARLAALEAELVSAGTGPDAAKHEDAPWTA